MRRIALPLVALVLAAPLLAGCESTFDKAARARAEAGEVAQVTAADIAEMQGVTADVEGLLTSPDGMTAAVVVRITTAAGTAILWPQIEIEVLDASGAVIGTNNIPGALPVLIHVPSAPGGAESVYVNDQIMVSGTPASARAIIDGAPFAGELPKPLEATEPTIVADPEIGDAWTTTVTNTTGVRQEQVIVQLVVRKDGKVVGAGTAQVQGGLDPGATADVTGYFVGSSDGELTVLVPPSNATGGEGAPAGDGTAGGGATSGSDTGATAPAATLQIG